MAGFRDRLLELGQRSDHSFADHESRINTLERVQSGLHEGATQREKSASRTVTFVSVGIAVGGFVATVFSLVAANT